MYLFIFFPSFCNSLFSHYLELYQLGDTCIDKSLLVKCIPIPKWLDTLFLLLLLLHYLTIFRWFKPKNFLKYMSLTTLFKVGCHIELYPTRNWIVKIWSICILLLFLFEGFWKIYLPITVLKSILSHL